MEMLVRTKAADGKMTAWSGVTMMYSVLPLARLLLSTPTRGLATRCSTMARWTPTPANIPYSSWENKPTKKQIKPGIRSTPEA